MQEGFEEGPKGLLAGQGVERVRLGLQTPRAVDPTLFGQDRIRALGRPAEGLPSWLIQEPEVQAGAVDLFVGEPSGNPFEVSVRVLSEFCPGSLEDGGSNPGPIHHGEGIPAVLTHRASP
jgi:hypothetical protein